MTEEQIMTAPPVIREMKHTALPWIAYSNSISSRSGYVASCIEYPEILNGQTFEKCLINAEFIVTACNNHYELLEALKELDEAAYYLETAGRDEPDEHYWDDLAAARIKAQQAIAEVEGGQYEKDT